MTFAPGLDGTFQNSERRDGRESVPSLPLSVVGPLCRSTGPQSFVRVTTHATAADWRELGHYATFDIEDVIASWERLNAVGKGTVSRETHRRPKHRPAAAARGNISAVYIVADFRAVSGHSPDNRHREENWMLIKCAHRCAYPCVQVFRMDGSAGYQGHERDDRRRNLECISHWNWNPPMSEKVGVLAFELRFPDGNWARLYLDGRTEGLPAGTIMVNWVMPHLYCLQAQIECGHPVLDNLLPSMRPEEEPPIAPLLARSSTTARPLSDEGLHTSPRQAERDPQ